MAPRISIVTVCYNAATTLERTIQAVLAQTCSDLEYIVIDGGSTDGTLDIIRKYQNRITFWRSEPDEGIADAFNKGLSHATGKYVGFVNADDWPDPDNAAVAVEILDAHPEAAFVYGDLTIYRQGVAVYRHQGAADYRSGFGLSMGKLNHPTLICRREMFDRIGLFDTSYRVAMDFDWLSRLHRAGFYGVYDSRIQGHMETGGTSVRLMLRGLAETRDAALAAGLPHSAVWRHFRVHYFKARLRLFVETHLSYHLAQWLRRHLFRSIEELSPKNSR
jgi:glycosyltransferase involved in cell wall biosynthesis